jgi:hypothetical protein
MVIRIAKQFLQTTYLGEIMKSPFPEIEGARHCGSNLYQTNWMNIDNVAKKFEAKNLVVISMVTIYDNTLLIAVQHVEKTGSKVIVVDE